MLTATKTRDGRIPLMHAGSLPRPPRLAALLGTSIPAPAPDPELLEKEITMGVRSAVLRQFRVGVDRVGDAEMGEISFMEPLTRLTGFGGPAATWSVPDMAALADPEEPAGWDSHDQPPGLVLRSNNDPAIEWIPGHTVARITRFRKVLDGLSYSGRAVLTAPSPGTMARLGTSEFTEYGDFLGAVAAAMRAEYLAITNAGFQLQLDCPDLAMTKHSDYPDMTVPEYLEIIRLNVAALNQATKGIDPELLSAHVCWGNYGGPHHFDIPLEEIIEVVYRLQVGTLMVGQANPQHAHEWRVFERHPLPPWMALALGVIDPHCRHVENPVEVADRLVRVAEIVGPDRIAASTDCGAATFSALPVTASQLAYLKLENAAEGARLASRRLGLI